MNTIIRTTAFALALVGSVSAYAAGGKAERAMLADFGPIVTMTAGGHDMHIQAIKDKTGGEWVVMSREDAETLFGHKIDAPFMLMKDHVAH